MIVACPLDALPPGGSLRPVRTHRVVVEDGSVECDWLYLPEVVRGGRDLDRSVELFHRVNRQDFDACERCQPSMTSRVYARGGVLVPSEHHIGGFHDWVREKLANRGIRADG